MVEFDKIWEFVEGKLKTTVPTYFKNILKVCGYNNGITIASIVQNDLSYFVEEVRSGNITKYFGEIDPKEIFEGSTKTEENFEFTRGHEKFLMSIVDLLKKRLDENGPDSFTLTKEEESSIERRSRKRVKIEKEKPVRKIMKRINFSSVDLFIESSSLTSSAHQEPSNGLSVPHTEDWHNQKKILQRKVAASLRTNALEMYMKNIKVINEKIARDLIKLDTIAESKDQKKSLDLPVDKSDVDKFKNKAVEDSIKYTAHITCPFCKASIRVFHVPGPSGQLIWKTSNFGRHLKNVHSNKTEISDEITFEELVASKVDTTERAFEADIENKHVDGVMKTSIEKPAIITSTAHETSKTHIGTVDIGDNIEKPAIITYKANVTPKNDNETVDIKDDIDEMIKKSFRKPKYSATVTCKAHETSQTDIGTVDIGDDIEKPAIITSKANETSKNDNETVDIKDDIDERIKTSFRKPKYSATVTSKAHETSQTDVDTSRDTSPIGKIIKIPFAITKPELYSRLVVYSDSDEEENKENKFSKLISSSEQDVLENYQKKKQEVTKQVLKRRSKQVLKPHLKQVLKPRLMQASKQALNRVKLTHLTSTDKYNSRPQSS